MVVLPGLALAATSAISKAQTTGTTGNAALSHKAVTRYSSLKAAFTVPKPSKQQKYIVFLTTLLSLTSDQQSQAASLLSGAGIAIAQNKTNAKALRQMLSQAVANNDQAKIRQISVAIGTLTAQRHAIGANANASLYQILSPNQQTALTQFRS
jgi:hypothetical protein